MGLLDDVVDWIAGEKSLSDFFEDDEVYEDSNSKSQVDHDFDSGPDEEPTRTPANGIWWYRINLYGYYYNYRGEQCFVSKQVIEVPAFKLDDQDAIARIVRRDYPDAHDCSGVQVSLHGEFYR